MKIRATRSPEYALPRLTLAVASYPGRERLITWSAFDPMAMLREGSSSA